VISPLTSQDPACDVAQFLVDQRDQGRERIRISITPGLEESGEICSLCHALQD
jgi:hypothetical protein